MKTILVTLSAFVSGLGFAAFPAQPEVPAASQDMPKPGPQHDMILELAGNWDAVVVMPGPDGNEQRSKGSMRTEKLGAFHTVDQFEGEMMGAPFHGRGINSYCPLRKQYVSTWVDSMGPSPIQLTGSYDAAKKELTMTGECVGMSGKLEPMRTVTRYADADHYTFSMFGPGPDGKEMKHMTIEYSRKK